MSVNSLITVTAARREARRVGKWREPTARSPTGAAGKCASRNLRRRLGELRRRAVNGGGNGSDCTILAWQFC